MEISDGAVSRVRRLCALGAGDHGPLTMLSDISRGLAAAGIVDAVRDHHTAAIYDWLIEAVSYQGVSDNVAATYMAQHGRPQFAAVSNGIWSPSCPKLHSYWHYESCGFHKGSRTCAEPEHLQGCRLPELDLRNGRLNQSAYALRLFFRDVANDDIVAWLDQRLAEAATVQGLGDGRRSHRLREAVLDPLAQVHGLSSKVISMALASLLLGADGQRTLWLDAGASMIAIDTLVHNWLHRSGTLAEHDASHAYGPRCYAPGGCADIIEQVAERIDARAFNADFPSYFPRFVQKAIWWFCAQAGMNECNGNRVDDRASCARWHCPVGDNCARVPLAGQP